MYLHREIHNNIELEFYFRSFGFSDASFVVCGSIFKLRLDKRDASLILRTINNGGKPREKNAKLPALQAFNTIMTRKPLD